MSDIQSWWNSLPNVTKYLLAGSLSLTLLSHFGVISPLQLIWNIELVYKNFQVWRLVTPFLLHGLGMSFLMSMMFLIRYGGSLETGYFAGRSADFLTMILFCAFALLVAGSFMGMAVMSTCLITSVIYFWARANPDVVVSFLFGISFKSRYLPWVMVAFTVLLGGNPLNEIVGIVVGHIYYTLAVLVPRDYGYDLLKTPQFLRNLFPNDAPPPGVAPMRHNEDTGPRGPRYDWGAGRALGRS